MPSRFVAAQQREMAMRNARKAIFPYALCFDPENVIDRRYSAYQAGTVLMMLPIQSAKFTDLL